MPFFFFELQFQFKNFPFRAKGLENFPLSSLNFNLLFFSDSRTFYNGSLGLAIIGTALTGNDYYEPKNCKSKTTHFFLFFNWVI